MALLIESSPTSNISKVKKKYFIAFFIKKTQKNFSFIACILPPSTVKSCIGCINLSFTHLIRLYSSYDHTYVTAFGVLVFITVGCYSFFSQKCIC